MNVYSCYFAGNVVEPCKSMSLAPKSPDNSRFQGSLFGVFGGSSNHSLRPSKSVFQALVQRGSCVAT